MQIIKLNEKIRSIKTVNKFKVTILNFIRPKGNSVFDIHDIRVINLNFSQLNEHKFKVKFKHNFKGTVDPMCTCGLELEATLHYLLRCNLYSSQRLVLLNNVRDLNPSLVNYSNKKLLNILLYGSEGFNCNMNKEILKATIKFLKISERFNGPRF